MSESLIAGLVDATRGDGVIGATAVVEGGVTAPRPKIM